MATTDFTANTTLKSTILVLSNFNYARSELVGSVRSANITFNVHSKLSLSGEVADHNHDFIVILTAKISGSHKDHANDSKDEPIFDGACEMVGRFGITNDDTFDLEFLRQNAGFFSLQMYPLLRAHMVETLSKMGINAIDAPWDIGLGSMVLSPE